MRKSNAKFTLLIVIVFAAPAWAQKSDRYFAEGYGFWGRRNSTPGTSVAGGGGEIFVFKGIGLGGDVGTTVGNPDNKITIGSFGGSYHFLCCQAKRKFEPFAGMGVSFFRGDINTHGYQFPNDPGNNRNGGYFNQGLIIWPYKHIGARIEVREYQTGVS
jgi:hypothetical protein